jgi:predicted dehydrogenase
MTKIIIAGVAALALNAARAQEAKPAVHLAIIGLTHDHASSFIPRLAGRTDILLAGIVESNHALTARYSERFHLDESLFHDTLDDLLARTNIQAAAIFTSPFEHRRVVEMCAPRGLAIMMEKPLAVNMEAAQAIAGAAKTYNVPVIVNYLTAYSPAFNETYGILHRADGIGEVRRMIGCFGHRGPKEIGCSADFLQWLTDPALNGGGAIVDFGCYGANLMTWFMDGRRPLSVFAVARHIKPDVYPKVDDDATIVLTYPKAEGVIMASWNWPYSRSDMEVYGQSGCVLAPRADTLRVRKEAAAEVETHPKPLVEPMADPLSYLAAVTRKEVQPSGPCSLEVNLVVTEILDAARESARTGRRIALPPDR